MRPTEDWPYDEAGGEPPRPLAWGQPPYPVKRGTRLWGCPEPYTVRSVTGAMSPPMKLETSVELLERLRAAEKVSWWKLPRLLDASESTVKNWKRGRTTIDQRFVTRIAELLHERPEYVLACIEAERAQSPEMEKIWRGIAEKFRSHAASILLSTALVFGVGNAGKAEAGEASPADVGSPPMYVMTNRRRRRPWWDFSTWMPVPA